MLEELLRHKEMQESQARAYLAPYLEVPDVRTQWNVVVLFLGLFAGSLVLWGVMLRKYFARV